jgi:hypothetical protein
MVLSFIGFHASIVTGARATQRSMDSSAHSVDDRCGNVNRSPTC